MKRISIIFVSAVLVIAGVIAFFYMNNSFAKDKASSAPHADLAFAVLGDVHDNMKSFQVAIKDLHSINPRMDVLVLNGDTVDQGTEKEYASVKKTINKNKRLMPGKIIDNIGNHELFSYDIKKNTPEQVQTFIKRYLQFSGEKKVYHDTWVNNYHFISLGSEDGNSEATNSITASISEEQLKWLNEKLAQNYQKGKPIFVFLHQPLDNGSRGWQGVKQSDEIRKILSKYPEVILFTSHTHRDLTENSVILNQPFTSIHTGAVHYTIIPDPNSKGGRKDVPYVKGLYVEVNGNKVAARGRDMKEKQWIFTKVITKEQ